MSSGLGRPAVTEYDLFAEFPHRVGEDARILRGEDRQVAVGDVAAEADAQAAAQEGRGPVEGAAAKRQDLGAVRDEDVGDDLLMVVHALGVGARDVTGGSRDERLDKRAVVLLEALKVEVALKVRSGDRQHPLGGRRRSPAPRRVRRPAGEVDQPVVPARHGVRPLGKELAEEEQAGSRPDENRAVGLNKDIQAQPRLQRLLWRPAVHLLREEAHGLRVVDNLAGAQRRTLFAQHELRSPEIGRPTADHGTVAAALGAAPHRASRERGDHGVGGRPRD